MRSVETHFRPRRMARIAAGAAAVPLLALAWSGCGTPSVSVTRDPAFVRTAESAAAETNAAGPLTWQAVTLQALRNSDEIAALRLDLLAAQTRRRTDTQFPDPQLRMRYGEGSAEEYRRSLATIGLEPLPAPGAVPPYLVPDGLQEQDQSSYGASLRVNLRHPFVTYHEKRRGDALVDAAASRLREAGWVVADDVRRSFLALRHLERQRNLLERKLEISRAARTAAQERVAAGADTLRGVARGAGQWLNIVADLNRNERRAVELRQELATLSGIPADRMELDLDAPLTSLEPDGLDPEKLEEFALKTRPDLAALEAEAAALRRAASAASAENIPWLDFIQGSFDRSETDSLSREGIIWTGIERESRDEDAEEWRVEASLRLPIFSWMTPRVKLARAEAAAAGHRVAALRARIGGDIRSSVRQVAGVREAMRRQEESAAPLSDEMKKALETLGDESLDPQTASELRENLLDIDIMRLDLDFDLENALLSLEKNLGIAPAPSAGGESR